MLSLALDGRKINGIDALDGEHISHAPELEFNRWVLRRSGVSLDSFDGIVEQIYDDGAKFRF